MAYGNTSDLNTYLSLTGRVLSGNPDHALEAGSQYIDTAYGARFRSVALSYDAEFPREAYNPTPTRVENAAYEAAYLWGQDNTSLSVTVSNNTTVKREKVEGAVEVEYFENLDKTTIAALPKYSVIEGLLYPFIRKEGGYFPSAFVV